MGNHKSCLPLKQMVEKYGFGNIFAKRQLTAWYLLSFLKPFFPRGMNLEERIQSMLSSLKEMKPKTLASE